MLSDSHQNYPDRVHVDSQNVWTFGTKEIYLGGITKQTSCFSSFSALKHFSCAWWLPVNIHDILTLKTYTPSLMNISGSWSRANIKTLKHQEGPLLLPHSLDQLLMYFFFLTWSLRSCYLIHELDIFSPALKFTIQEYFIVSKDTSTRACLWSMSNPLLQNAASMVMSFLITLANYTIYSAIATIDSIISL